MLAREVLASMFTPAILISAGGTLVLSTSNRLSRVVDRVRALSEEVGHPNPGTSVEAKSRQKLVSDQLNTLFSRAMFLRTAITILYVALGLFVATILAVGIVASLEWRFGWFPVVSELLGVSLLLYVCTLLVREARLAVQTSIQEMNYVRELMSRGG